MYQFTHDKSWKNSPGNKTVFVSEFVQHTYPVIDKHKNIKKVLDIACGNGLGVTIPLLKRGYNVYAFDHLKSAIDATKANAKKHKINLKISDMYKPFPYKSNLFDAAFCFQAIFQK